MPHSPRPSSGSSAACLAIPRICWVRARARRATLSSLAIGCPPLQAKKARYFEDRRFTERGLPPPQPGGTPAPVAADEWSALPLRRPPEAQAAQVHQESEDTANSGLRREPDLPEHVAIANEATAAPPAREFDVLVDDTDDSVALQARALSRQMRGLARQTVLDPGDGLGM